MRTIAWFVLALMPALPASAQTPSQPAGPPTASSPSGGDLPLAAMRHQQPTRAQVDQRESVQLGAKKAQQEEEQQRAAEDQLYNEIMRRSAPGASLSNGGAGP